MVGSARRQTTILIVKFFQKQDDCVLKKSVEATSMAEVAQKVGIKPAGLYYYFKPKNDILYVDNWGRMTYF